MAVVFGGTPDRIECGSSFNLNFTDSAPMSMSCWVSVSTLTPAGAQALCGRGFDGTKTAYSLATDNTGPGIDWYSFNSPTVHGFAPSSAGGGGVILYSALGWAINQFHHVYGQYDGTQWNIAFDGGFTLTPVTDAGEFNVPAPVKFVIGAIDSNGTPGQFFTGCLADVALYNGPLTATEVTDLGNGTLRPNTSMSKQLLGYWPLDVAAATYTDMSGLGNTGTAFGGAATNTCSNSPPYHAASTFVLMGQICA